MNDVHTSSARGRRAFLKPYDLCVKEGHRSNTGKGLKQVVQDLDKGTCIQC